MPCRNLVQAAPISALVCRNTVATDSDGQRLAIDLDQRVAGMLDMAAQQVGGGDDLAGLAQVKDLAVLGIGTRDIARHRQLQPRRAIVRLPRHYAGVGC